jgi:hypothetical protein
MATHYLGRMELTNGEMLDVEYLRDLFLNHCFKDPANWELLRSILNILLQEYKARFPSTQTTLVEGKIAVETQYEYLVGKAQKRTQDAKVTEEDRERTTFVEFQNRANIDVAISSRALQYFALGLAVNRGNKVKNQIWVLAEDDDELLHGQVFANYVLVDEVGQHRFPNQSGILFVSLKRLAKEYSQAGELAALLLGENPDPSDGLVREIANGFKKHFVAFKEDKSGGKMSSRKNGSSR